ncbi:MAG: hypothetical protein AAF829_00355 [Pseudomonadota bacterium]
MLRLIGLVLVLAGLAVAGLGVMAWTAPMERIVIAAPQPKMPESRVLLISASPEEDPVANAQGFTGENRFNVESTTRSAASETVAAGEKTVPVAHETPREARFGQPFEVTLSIDATGASQAAEALPGTGKIVEAQVALSGDIQARLNGGTAFDVALDSPADQALSPASPNVWRWTVMPLASGEHTLVIDVFMKTESGTLQPISSYSDRITVHVSTLRQAITFAQTANPLFMVLGGIGSVLGGAVTALRFFSKSTGRG